MMGVTICVEVFTEKATRQRAVRGLRRIVMSIAELAELAISVTILHFNIPLSTRDEDRFVHRADQW